ncbi:MAG: WXG100 family type VII secretion target [Actinomycetota bacterium]|nr:WXG100 family type VII secretion target [Actinomycetota bacterium]
MAVYKVSSEVLTETAGKLTAGSGEAQDLLSGLRKLVESLGSDWEGSGAGAFTELYTEFNNAGTQLTESLEGIAAMLSKAAAYYAESETNVANAFRS